MSIPKKASVVLVLVLVLSAALPGCGTVATAPAGRYIASDAVDVKSVLRDPPADNSTVTRGELDRILAFQASRTPEELARIKGESVFSPDLLTSVLGPSYKPDALPATEALLKYVSADAKIVIGHAKSRWSRPRPWLPDTRIQPCLDKPKSFSYPSDGAAQVRVWAVVLGELFPAKKDLLLEKADQISQDRVIAGIHYPSDIEAGKQFGQAIAAKLMQSPAFMADLAAARSELAKATP